LFSVFIAVVYSYQFLLFVTIPNVFSKLYHFSVGATGLAYLGIAIGLLIGNSLFGQISDRILIRKANGEKLKPEYRLPLMIPGAFCIPACFFIYGWTTQYQVHWIVPICATSLLGIGLNMSLVSSCRATLKCNSVLTFPDDYSNLPRRRVHVVRSLRLGCSDHSAIHLWGLYPTCRSAPVR
jgi:MFS family permease